MASIDPVATDVETSERSRICPKASSGSRALAKPGIAAVSDASGAALSKGTGSVGAGSGRLKVAGSADAALEPGFVVDHSNGVGTRRSGNDASEGSSLAEAGRI